MTTPDRTLRTIGIASLAALATFRLAATSDPDPTPSQPACIRPTVRGPRLGGLAQYSLPNGATLLLIPDSSVAVTRVMATYRVGSRHENQGETGVAHVLEHMLFRGTPRHPDISRELALHGARYNATTTQDYTSFFETFPAADANLAWALDLEADRMVDGTLRAEDLTAERRIVLREIDLAEADPFRVLIERTTAAAYAFHPYGKIVAGSRLDVDRVTAPRLRDFYRKHYYPENVVVTIAGRFDERAAVAAAERSVGKVTPRCSVADTATYSVEPPQEGERRITIRRPAEGSRLMAAYHMPAASHPDAAALSVLGKVLTDRDEGFLTQSMKTATGVGSAVFPRHDPSLLTFTATVTPGVVIDTAIRRLGASLDSAASVAPTESAVGRAKAALIADMDRSMSPRLDFASLLSEWIGAGDWRLFYVHRSRISQVTPADVRRVAATYLLPSNRTIGVFIADSARAAVAVPTAPALAGEYAQLEKAMASAPAAAAASRARDDVTWDGTPEKLDAALRVDTLQNGLRVATLPVTGGDVLIRLVVRYGSNALLENRWAASQVFTSISFAGPADMTPAAFRELKNSLDIDLGAASGPGYLALNSNASRKTVGDAIRLISRTVRNPRLDSATIESTRQEKRLTLSRAGSIPSILARRTLQLSLWQLPPAHPLYEPLVPAADSAFAKVTADEVRRIYTELWSPSNMVLLIVGDIPRDSVHRIAREAFADWSKSAPKAEPVWAPYVETRAAHIDVPAPGQRDGLMMAGLLVPLGRNDPDLAAMRVASHIIGSGSITSRLGARIREQAGLSYTARGSLESPKGKASAFLVTANGAPESLPRVEQLVREELGAAVRDGFTEADVARAREEMANSWRGFVGQPRQVASLLSELLTSNLTFADEIADQERQAAVTAESVTRAVRKYIDPARLVTVYVGGRK